MIKITDLEKIYRTEEVETVALNKMNLEVNEREFVAIMGPSGCGKSTLLNILGMIDEADSGSFLFNGTEVSKFNENKRCDLRKANIGFVFQSFNLIDELTVFENVELPLIYNNVKAAERKTFLYNMLNVNHKVNVSLNNADFLIDRQLRFSYAENRLNGKKNENIVYAVDDVEVGVGNEVPLWLFGFLY